jgi:hypothetical protein
MEHAAKYPRSLLGVVGSNAERHQALANKLVLIRVLRTQRLGKGVPRSLEDNYELLGLDIPIMGFPGHFPEEDRKLLCWIVRLFKLLGKRGP